MAEADTRPPVPRTATGWEAGWTSRCAVKLGKILNVKYLLVGTFGKLMDQYVLNFRMVETETAKVVYSDDARELSTQREVSKSIGTMVDRLVRAAVKK